MLAAEVYAPRHRTSASAEEVADGCASKRTRGLLLESHGACGEDEDAVSMALTAVLWLLRRCRVRAEDVVREHLRAARRA